MSTAAYLTALSMTLPPPSQPSRGGRASSGSTRPALICSFCGGHFQRSNGLKRHMRIHTGERPYPCSECDAAFTRTDLIRRHLLLNHGIDSSGSRSVTTDQSTAKRKTPTASTSAASKPQRLKAHASVLQATTSAASDSASGSSHPLALVHDHVGTSTFDATLQLPATNRPGQPAGNHEPDWSQQPLSHLFDFMIPSPTAGPAPSAATGSSTLSMAMSTPSLSSSRSSHPTHGTPTEWTPRRPLEQPPTARVSPMSAAPGLYPSSHPSVSPALPQAQAQSQQDPQPRTQHLRLFIQHFSKHLPCVHAPTYEALQFTLDHGTASRTGVKESDADLLRAMAVVGASYDSESLYQHGLPCDFYGAVELRAGLLRAMADKGEGSTQGRYKRRRPSLFASGVDEASDDEGVRQAQTLLLLQFVSLLSRNAFHQSQARQLHGTLVTAARDLLQIHRTEMACALLPFASTARTIGEGWRKWARSEERLRTLWAIYAFDALTSVCWHQPRLLSLSELSDLAPPCDETLWQAIDAAQWAERASVLHRLNPSGPRRHSAPGLSSYMGCYPGQPSSEAPLSLDASTLLAVAASSIRSSSVFEAYSALLSPNVHRGPAPPPTLADMPVTGMLLLAQSICAEVVELGGADLAAKEQLQAHGTRPQHHRTVTTTRAAHTDDHLRRRTHELEAALGRWLEAYSLIEDPFRTSNTPASVPFLADPMPWYWAAFHYLAQLRARPPSSVGGLHQHDHFQQSGQAGPSGAHPLDMWMPQASASSATPAGAYGHQGALDSLALPPPCTPQGPNSVLCFLVHLRDSIRSIDGGANLVRSLGAPWTLEYEARVAAATPSDPASLFGFFPPLFSQP